jgi:hypothetical protein
MEDGSAQALKRFPESFLDRWRIMNTSLLSREPPNVLDDALAAIRRDIESGQIEAIIAGYRTLEREYGDGSVFTAWP